MAIASAVRKGSLVIVYDEKSRQLSSISCSGSDELRGYTSSTVSIKKGSLIIVYDEKGRQISSHSAR